MTGDTYPRRSQVWIFDVDGQRLVVNARHTPTTPASDVDKLTSMVESLAFVDAE